MGCTAGRVACQLQSALRMPRQTWKGALMRTGSALGRLSWVAITIVAAVVAVAGGDEGHGWPFVLGHFLVAWILTAAFAQFGKFIFRPP